ncbi:extracellular solute-binding protein [Microcoleus sp. FACHB-1515]|uniref:extracellular solute-binding protein n=1 Tax=Cyanophyceae TaxID=3028117 RepID=UPI001688A66B|nr:extracellular solute-binding protein [Microcoleus sp. FACHB-1515]MBD2093118.1 extracellular solute-binding protein [Microcoleus sp. FACHB-1515]
MINRRSLLVGMGSVSIAALLSSCNRPNDSTLRVQLLKDSLPPQLLGQFQQQANTKIAVNSQAQLANLYKLLQTAQQPQGGLLRRSPPAADLVSLGDSWLNAAIAQNLIQPLELQDSAAWQNLPQRWRDLAQRNGQIWAAPYRWGTLMIVYRRDAFDRLDWKIQDWADLWRSPLQGKLGLIDSPRVAVGVTLKKLGRSFNLDNLSSVPTLEAELRSLHQQLRFYSSEAYLQPLLLGQIWAAIGWSFEILPVLERNYKLGAVIPPSGTLLNADLWVRPKSDRPANPLLNQLIEFCWQPEVATAISLLSDAASPVLEADRANLPDALREDGLKLPAKELLDRSEFLQPLPKTTVDQYRRLWETVRS